MSATLPKVYLGDGVYVETEPGGFVLTTEDGYRTTNTIVLDHETWSALKQYVDTSTPAEDSPMIVDAANAFVEKYLAPDPDTVPPWWMDHANLAELHRYLTGSDCPEGDALDPSQVQYFLEKPWKWTQEWERMRKARS